MTMEAQVRAHPDVTRVIDRYFRGKAGLGAVTAHLEDCDACRAYFARRQLLASLDPSARPVVERVAQSAGLPVARPPRLMGSAPLLAAASACAALALVIALPQDGTSDGFTARGRATARALDDVRVFRVQGEQAEPVTGTMAASDELAFAYRNPRGHARLMVYGVDERGGVYWYHPAWTDPAKDPVAVPITTSESLVELKEAVRHDLAGVERLRIYALFTDDAVAVSEVERRLAAGRPPAAARLLEEIRVER